MNRRAYQQEKGGEHAARSGLQCRGGASGASVVTHLTPHSDACGCLHEAILPLSHRASANEVGEMGVWFDSISALRRVKNEPLAQACSANATAQSQRQRRSTAGFAQSLRTPAACPRTCRTSRSFLSSQRTGSPSLRCAQTPPSPAGDRPPPVRRHAQPHRRGWISPRKERVTRACRARVGVSAGHVSKRQKSGQVVEQPLGSRGTRLLWRYSHGYLYHRLDPHSEELHARDCNSEEVAPLTEKRGIQ